MEEYRLELLAKLVGRYNALHQRAFNAYDDGYRDSQKLRALEVRFIIEELFGEDSVKVEAKQVAHMSIRKD